MIRTVRISLANATAAKRRRLLAVLREQRAAANFYARSVWFEPGSFNAATLRRYTGGSLGYRGKSNALKVATETVSASKKAANALGQRARIPKFRRAIRLDAMACSIEKGKGFFDYVLKVPHHNRPGKPIIIPFRGHKRLNHWLAKGGKIVNSVRIANDGITAYLAINVPDLPDKPGEMIGIDIGYRHCIADSDGNLHGSDFRKICNRVRHRRPGSKSRSRAARARTNYINRTVKQLPWERIGVIKVEDLTGLRERTFDKRAGKSSKRSRKQMAPWAYRAVITRVQQNAQENRVRLDFVDPRNTSRTCPSCGSVSKGNRRAEAFRCVECNYKNHADKVGALNVLAAPSVNRVQSMVALSACGSNVRV